MLPESPRAVLPVAGKHPNAHSFSDRHSTLELFDRVQVAEIQVGFS
jgi:hypothetical protein